MKKFKIQTEKKLIKTYLLTYEIEAEDEGDARSKIFNGGYIPVDEEFFDEYEDEKTYEIEEL